MTTIIDYGMGNLRSLINALQFLGERVNVASSSKEIERAEKIVFPGVGSFGQATKSLKRKKIDPTIKRKIQEETPFLGICLGLQLLFEESQEAPGEKGLGIFEGKILRFKNIKIPQMGWNQIKLQKKSKIFKETESNSFVYFMHSFYAEPKVKKIVVAKTDYGKDFCSAVELNNIFGVQFHPEKSGQVGLKILKNFIEL